MMIKQYYKNQGDMYGRKERIPLPFFANLSWNVWRFFVRNGGKNAALTAMVFLVATLIYAYFTGRI